MPIRWIKKNLSGCCCTRCASSAMTGLLIGTFSFFGIHTLTWGVRSIYLYMHDSKTFREA